MKKRYVIPILLSLVSTHSFSAPHSINVLQSTPIIDGHINNNEWPKQHAVKLSRAFHEQRSIRLYYAHDENYLYLAAEVDDQQLWADGGGNGSGNIWESFNDDSIEWYFDLDKSKDKYLQKTDRFLALNIGNLTDSVNGSGIVSRRSFNAGDGNGGAVGVLDPNSLEGINYKVVYQGTVNDATDLDIGYSIEIAIPWSLLSNVPHADGDSIGINAIIISDDSGGTRDLTDNRGNSSADIRFTSPVFIDEYVELKHSGHHGSQSGLNGPAAYTTLNFHNNLDIIPPAAITNFIAAHSRPYSLRLQWNNPGDNLNTGVSQGFEIRYSKEPITDANFAQATNWPFNKQLDLSPFGTTNLRVMGLNPETTYYFAVRAYDEAGNFGPLAYSSANTISIVSLNSAISPEKYQGVAAVAPGGRYFIKENGQSLIPIGAHYLHQDDAIRYLYNDDIWTGTECHNFTKNPEAEKKVSDYMAKLKANGITVMRLFLEDSSLNVPNNGIFNKQNCAYWLESPRGNFNTKMADFLVRILRLSAENGIYVLISPFETFFYDEYLPRMAWHKTQGGPLTDINNFFTNPDVLAMAKSRWSWVINEINKSGYADAVFGYEIMNEWDSHEWTRPDTNANTDAQIRRRFIESLTQHVRSLDSEHLIISSTTALDPRGSLANFIYHSDTFDAVLPHLYLPSNREPWNNPETHIGTSIVKEQSNILSWWTSNQENAKPVLNGEWGPSDGWLPNPEQPSYFSGFNEADDELITRKLWFTELASGAAGPGIRMQGGVRGGSELGLHLSEKMLGTTRTISSFVKNESHIDFTNFMGERLQDSLTITNTQAPLIGSGTTDGKQGLVYIHQDKNKNSSPVENAFLNLGSLKGGASMLAEFWSTQPNQIQAKHVISSNIPSLKKPNDKQFVIPRFDDDWMVKFYEQYSMRLKTWRDQGQQVFALENKDMNKAGSVDVYFVYNFNGEFFSLTRNAQGQINSTLGVNPFERGVIPADGIDEIVRIPVLGNISVDIYIATVAKGINVQSLNFKTLQLNHVTF